MKTFDAFLSLTLARLSEIAYIDDDITTKLKSLGFDLVKRIGKTGDVSGFICRTADYSVLVFQGTDIRDWQTIKEDLKIWHTREDHVRWAAGFNDAYEELLPEFIDCVRTCDVPLYITGHSLGGAIALITALHADRFEACYTFGAPRVCSLSGEKLDDGKSIFRVVHENDIVPSLPFLVLGYWPFIGELIYITASNKIVRGWPAYPARISGQILPIIKKSIWGIAGFVQNHFAGQYIKALEAITGGEHGKQRASESGAGKIGDTEGSAAETQSGN